MEREKHVLSQLVGQNLLGDELESFARELQVRSGVLKEKTSQSIAVDSLAARVDDLAENTQNTKTKKKKKTNTQYIGHQLQFTSEQLKKMVVAAWGDTQEEMDNIERGLEYASKELEAQDKARAQAKEAEGGYYKVLGVTEQATRAELRKGYHKKMARWHPDKVAAEEASRSMDMANLIREAYQCLSNKWERVMYDFFGLQQYLVHVRVVQTFKNYLANGVPIKIVPTKKPSMFASKKVRDR